jgi:hypothetical protein
MRRSHGTGKHTAMNRALRAPGRYAHGSMESHLEDAATAVCNEPIGGPSAARDFADILKRRSVPHRRFEGQFSDSQYRLWCARFWPPDADSTDVGASTLAMSGVDQVGAFRLGHARYSKPIPRETAGIRRQPNVLHSSAKTMPMANRHNDRMNQHHANNQQATCTSEPPQQGRIQDETCPCKERDDSVENPNARQRAAMGTWADFRSS